VIVITPRVGAVFYSSTKDQKRGEAVTVGNGECEMTEDCVAKSAVLKRSVVIDGHKTSVSLEDAFWRRLKKIAAAESGTLSKLVSEIDETRQNSNLSSAIRVFVLEHSGADGKP
jgi:predicted DNA-binding ribbon-helix-helix protein